MTVIPQQPDPQAGFTPKQARRALRLAFLSRPRPIQLIGAIALVGMGSLVLFSSTAPLAAVALGALFVGLGGWTAGNNIYAARLRLREHRLLGALAVSRVASLSPGPALLVGRIRAVEPVQAPFSGRSGAWCAWQGMMFNRQGGSRSGPVRLDDGSGSVPLDMTGAVVDVPLATAGGGGRTPMLEAVLPDGATVFVWGTARRGGVAVGPSESAAEKSVHARLAELKQHPDELPRYGVTPGEEVTPERWDGIVAAVKREIADAPAPAVEPLIVGGEPGRELRISTRDLSTATSPGVVALMLSFAFSNVVVGLASVAILVGWTITGGPRRPQTARLPTEAHWSLGAPAAITVPRTREATIKATVNVPSLGTPRLPNLTQSIFELRGPPGEGQELQLFFEGHRLTLSGMGGVASCSVAEPGKHAIVAQLTQSGVTLTVDGHCDAATQPVARFYAGLSGGRRTIVVGGEAPPQGGPSLEVSALTFEAGPGG